LGSRCSLPWIAAPAVAADIPNLVGEWSGTAEAVVIGSGGYRPGEQTLEDPPFVDQRVFNYSIKSQAANSPSNQIVATCFLIKRK
jgi:hypothetical protein